MAGELPEFDLDGFLPYRLTVVAERLSASLARRYREKAAISVADWRILVHLSQAEAVSVRDIERQVNLEKSKVSRAVTRLEGKGWVARAVSAADRRLLELSLTPKGQALMAELLPLAAGYQAELVAALGEDWAPVLAALERLAAHSK
jgi:DNA-binding MarR family transcriptional regulator